MRLVRKLLRYASVSLVATTVSLVNLAALVVGGVTTPGWANVIATGVGTVPSFELNRRWVWGKSGRRSLWAEVGPFCILSFTELGLSTLAVHAASAWAVGLGYGLGVRAAVAVGANVATFGSLWMAQFVLLDRVLFRAQAQPSTGAAAPDVLHPSTATRLPTAPRPRCPGPGPGPGRGPGPGPGPGRSRRPGGADALAPPGPGRAGGPVGLPRAA